MPWFDAEKVSGQGGTMNDDRTWERIGLGAGLALALVLAARTLITPTVPKDPAVWAAFFADKQSVWLWTVWLTGVVVVVGTWFYGSVRAVIARAEGGAGRVAMIFFGAWLIQGTLAAARHAIIAIPAMVPGLDAGVVGSLLVIGAAMLGMVWFAFLLQAVAVAMVTMRTKALPAWIGWISWLAAIVAALGTLAIVQTDGLFARAGGFRWVVLWTYIGWIALLSVAALMSSDSVASD
jgi:hypothetical protein